MRDKRQHTLFEASIGVTAVGVMLLWAINAGKFVACDFKPDYRCEAIHGVGLLPPLSIFTVWFGSDGE